METRSARSRAHASIVLITLLILCGVSASVVSTYGVSSAAIDWSLSADISKKPAGVRPSPLDRGSAFDLWAEVLVSTYGVSIDFVRGLYDRGYEYGDIALLMELCRTANKEPADVVKFKRQGLGWGAVARRLGVHPSALDRAKGNESLFRRYVLARSLGHYYKIPDSGGLEMLNEKGYSFDDIALAVNVSAHTGAPLREVVSARQSGMRWRFVAEKFKMSPAKLGTPPRESGVAAEKGKTPASSGEKAPKGQKTPGKK
jgi:hypothetical protein